MWRRLLWISPLDDEPAERAMLHLDDELAGLVEAADTPADQHGTHSTKPEPAWSVRGEVSVVRSQPTNAILTMPCTVPCRAVLCCAVLCCAVLFCAVLCCAVRCGAVRCGAMASSALLLPAASVVMPLQCFSPLALLSITSLLTRLANKHRFQSTADVNCCADCTRRG